MRLKLLVAQLVLGFVCLAGGVISIMYVSLILGGLLFVVAFAVLGSSAFGVGGRSS